MVKVMMMLSISSNHISRGVVVNWGPNGRFFLNVHGTNGRFYKSPSGKNMWTTVAKEIAKFLGYENYEAYTSHSFRRSAASAMAENGATKATDDDEWWLEE